MVNVRIFNSKQPKSTPPTAKTTAQQQHPEQHPEQQPDPDSDILSRYFPGVGETEGITFHISRKNGEGKIALVGTMIPPVDWEEVARRWGGGTYWVMARKDGRIVDSDWLHIDPVQFPRVIPETPEPPATISAPGVDGIREEVRALAASLGSQQQPTRSEVRAELINEMAMLKEIIGVSTKTPVDNMFEIFKSGVAIGSDSGGEKSIVDVLDKHLAPAIAAIEKVAEARKSAVPTPRGSERPPMKTVNPNEGPRVESKQKGPDVIAEVMKGAAILDPNVDKYAVLVDGFAPPFVQHQIKTMPPEEIINLISRSDPRYKKLFLSDKVKQWVRDLIEIIQNPELESADDIVDLSPDPEPPVDIPGKNS